MAHIVHSRSYACVTGNIQRQNPRTGYRTLYDLLILLLSFFIQYDLEPWRKMEELLVNQHE